MNCPEGSGGFAAESITDRTIRPRRSVRYLDLLLPCVDHDSREWLRHLRLRCPLPTDPILAQAASARGSLETRPNR